MALMRPAQWVKNVFVFAPLFFGGSLFDAENLLWSVLTAAMFCLMSSAIYCLNDIRDAESDRRHPLKQNRPVASGAVSERQAYGLVGALSVASMCIAMTLPPDRGRATATVLLVYFLMNVAYCLWLKHIAVVDVCVVATGFVLRVVAGSTATLIEPSRWIVLMTFLLTLFLSLCKRRDDVVRMNRTGEPPRRNTPRYNLAFTDHAITLTGTGCLVCYAMYTMSPDICGKLDTSHLYLTVVFVVVGLLRYMQLTMVDERSGDPTAALLHDRFCLIAVALWLFSFIFAIYM